jgi:hypothetical protein
MELTLFVGDWSAAFRAFWCEIHGKTVAAEFSLWTFQEAFAANQNVVAAIARKTLRVIVNLVASAYGKGWPWSP